MLNWLRVSCADREGVNLWNDPVVAAWAKQAAVSAVTTNVVAQMQCAMLLANRVHQKEALYSQYCAVPTSGSGATRCTRDTSHSRTAQTYFAGAYRQAVVTQQRSSFCAGCCCYRTTSSSVCHTYHKRQIATQGVRFKSRLQDHSTRQLGTCLRKCVLSLLAL